MTTAVVLQPGYLPWLGFFEQLHRCDVFVLLDDVQYDKNGWRNRNRIRTPTARGWTWLTVPVAREHLTMRRVRDVRVARSRVWATAHWRTLQQSYRKAPYFEEHAEFFTHLYGREWDLLYELDRTVIDYLARAFGIERPIVRSSELAGEGSKTDRLVAICKRLGASRYYSGAAARTYLDTGAMREAGIEVEFQEYEHPVYPQVYEPFIPYLSSVDLLFNCGPSSVDVLLGRPLKAHA